MAKATRPILTRTWASAVKRAALAAGGLAAACLIAEVSIRILDLQPPSLRGKTYLQPLGESKVLYHCYSSNPHGEFAPVPEVSSGQWRLSTASLPPTELPVSDLKKTPWCVEDRRSDQDLRDRHYEPVAPAGKIRLAMVGDSFVRGEGVPVERSLPKQLESLLGTNQFEVVNAGAAGFGTEEEVGVAQRVGPKLNTSRILLVFIPNDIHLTKELAHRQDLINDLINIRGEHLDRELIHNWFYENSRLARFVLSFFEMRKITQETIQWYLDSYKPEYNADGLKRLSENFRTLAALPNCRVALILYPLMSGLESEYPLAPIHARVKGLATEAGLPVLDLATAFAGSRTRDLQVHPCDHHPNSRAHSIAAGAIKKWLETDLADFLAAPTNALSVPSVRERRSGQTVR